MALTERTRVYETLIRHNHNGTVGAHQIRIHEMLRDGVVRAATPLDAEPITAELNAVLGENLVLALAANARLTIELAAAIKAYDDLLASIDGNRSE